MLIMSFNIRIDVDVDGVNKFTNRLEGIIDFINKTKPDIIGFQEVNHSMLQSLIALLPNYHFVGEPRNDKGEYNPIFYLREYKLIKTNTYWLSKTPNIPGSKHPKAYFPRIFTTITLEIDKRIFEIVNTHLSHISQLAREDGMHDLIKYYHNTKATNFILMGDFNAYPNQGVDEIISQHLNSCWNVYSGDQLTYHDFQDETIGLPIDYIFTSKNIIIKEVDIYRNKYHNLFLSDHYPISITIE